MLPLFFSKTDSLISAVYFRHTPSSCGDLLIRSGESVRASFTAVMMPATGLKISLAAFTLSTTPASPAHVQTGITACYSIYSPPFTVPCFTDIVCFSVLLLYIGCFTSKQLTSVSQGQNCSDNCLCCHTEREVANQIFYLGGRNSSVGSAWTRCPQRRGFDPPLGTFSVEGIFPLELTWVQTPFPQKLLRMSV